MVADALARRELELPMAIVGGVLSMFTATESVEARDKLPAVSVAVPAVILNCRGPLPLQPLIATVGVLVVPLETLAVQPVAPVPINEISEFDKLIVFAPL